MNRRNRLRKMDGSELKNLINVWILAVTSLCYCFYIPSRIPKGLLRLLSLLPVFYLFIILPLNLSSFHFCAVTASFLVWLANFKLLPFAFNQPPLFPPINLFISFQLLLFPSKPNQTKPTSRIAVKKPVLNLAQLLSTINNANSSYYQTTYQIQISYEALKSILLGLKGLLLAYEYYREYLHDYVVLALHGLQFYLELEVILALCATPARVFGFEVEPHFNEPFLGTSLQDFWGRRWNLVVSSILRPTVYNLVRRISTRVLGERRAYLPSVISTFVVSGPMHEVIYYYLTRVPSTWEVTWFFVLQGICLSIEIEVKKGVANRWRLHRVVSGPLAVVFVGASGAWLFAPQLAQGSA